MVVSSSDVIAAQEAQLAISDSRSVLQEQQWNNQGQAVQVFDAEPENETYPLPETKENPIVQVDEGRHYYPTILSLRPSLSFPKNTKKYSLGPHFFTQKPP